MYLDEFSVNFRNSSVYGWGPIGKGGFLQTHIDSFSMSFMIGFSDKRLYGVIGTSATHNQRSFIIFIQNSIKLRAEKLKIDDINFIIICDNSSIHKDVEVKNYLKETKIRILTICPYSPDLNPWEKMILYIKQTLNVYKNKECK